MHKSDQEVGPIVVVAQNRVINCHYQNEFYRYLSSSVLNEPIMCLDPGETMGWSFFRNGCLEVCGQLNVMKQLRFGLPLHFILNPFFDYCKDRAQGTKEPLNCVIENYVVYGHKIEANVWNPLFTTRLIGAIWYCCSMLTIPMTFQMASEAKFFGTDTKLRKWGLYQFKLKHANDSIRHGLYYMLKKSRIGGEKYNSKGACDYISNFVGGQKSNDA